MSYLASRYPLHTFFALVFIISWLAWFPLVLTSRGWLPIDLPAALALLGAFGPTVAGLLVAALADGRPGVRELFSRVLHWRVGSRWYLVALLGPAAIFTIAVAGQVLASGTFPNWADVPVYQLYPEASLIPLELLIFGTFLMNLLVGGALNEELGWRGFALPRLQARLGALGASLLLGAVWAVWHLPLFLIAGTSQSQMSPLSFAVGTIALSIVFTWLFNYTGRSVLLAILLHAAFNTSFALMPLPIGGWLGTGVWVFVALLLVIFDPLMRARRQPEVRAGSTAAETPGRGLTAQRAS